MDAVSDSWPLSLLSGYRWYLNWRSTYNCSRWTSAACVNALPRLVGITFYFLEAAQRWSLHLIDLRFQLIGRLQVWTGTNWNWAVQLEFLYDYVWFFAYWQAARLNRNQLELSSPVGVSLWLWLISIQRKFFPSYECFYGDGGDQQVRWWNGLRNYYHSPVCSKLGHGRRCGRCSRKGWWQGAILVELHVVPLGDAQITVNASIQTTRWQKQWAASQTMREMWPRSMSTHLFPWTEWTPTFRALTRSSILIEAFSYDQTIFEISSVLIDLCSVQVNVERGPETWL
jgi:hypothetical protein